MNNARTGFKLPASPSSVRSEGWFDVSLSHYFLRGVSPTPLLCSPPIISKYVREVRDTADDHLTSELGMHACPRVPMCVSVHAPVHTHVSVPVSVPMCVCVCVCWEGGPVRTG